MSNEPNVDGLPRCPWPGEDALYRHYHDYEWGRPVTDDVRLFEKICLEGFQSGLSWITILRKRERFREVFHGFDIAKVAAMTEADVEVLLQDAGIIRHRGKINATINNAKRALLLQKEFGSLAAYFWRFEPKPGHREEDYSWAALSAVGQTDASRALSKDLRKRGFNFVGPTTCYAFMQAMGMVNDHTEDCFCRVEVEAQRAALVRPK
ncbi:3-methyladenine DNA glycosylase [Devosia epidermidihirudinis]|uniref:3-methyladenine DNA glycosylase n=1 Tax=Devosia epidermidihirudinis TaxID=1293439 RepID=A0A0F5Q3Y3_9HYPH|nr:DNA-3-methyladenine glycosylase I [Devosia epidermidihirudinis]KKC35346.1 3-methyladenine DNA glycosylase [Devosia epidermidihirudinis]